MALGPSSLIMLSFIPLIIVIIIIWLLVRYYFKKTKK